MVARRRFRVDHELTGSYSGVESRSARSSGCLEQLLCRIKGCQSEAVYLFDSSVSCRTEKSRIKRGSFDSYLIAWPEPVGTGTHFSGYRVTGCTRPGQSAIERPTPYGAGDFFGRRIGNHCSLESAFTVVRACLLGLWPTC
jgi:hypothetical protein